MHYALKIEFYHALKVPMILLTYNLSVFILHKCQDVTSDATTCNMPLYGVFDIQNLLIAHIVFLTWLISPTMCDHSHGVIDYSNRIVLHGTAILNNEETFRTMRITNLSLIPLNFHIYATALNFQFWFGWQK